MTPKEKAKNIYAKYHTPLLNYKGGINPNEAIELQKCAKQCALIAVDVILIDCGAKDWAGDEACEGKNFWQEVKTEIEKL